jgi:hypothetical protein
MEWVQRVERDEELGGMLPEPPGGSVWNPPLLAGCKLLRIAVLLPAAA